MTALAIEYPLPAGCDWWTLTGPVGALLDQAVALCIAAGLPVEFAAAGQYRVAPGTDPERRGQMALVVESYGAGYSLTRVTPTLGVHVASTLQAPAGGRRVTTVSGADIASLVARAVDRRLTVKPSGDGHFTVSGSSRVQLEWLAAERTEAAVLADWCLTLEQVDAEDNGATVQNTVIVQPASVNSVPTVSTFERNDDGDIVRVTQTPTPETTP